MRSRSGYCAQPEADRKKVWIATIALVSSTRLFCGNSNNNNNNNNNNNTKKEHLEYY
jgi:hypothetical protein